MAISDDWDAEIVAPKCTDEKCGNEDIAVTLQLYIPTAFSNVIFIQLCSS